MWHTKTIGNRGLVMDGTESLERLKLWVQIASTIALPIVVFVVGNQLQRSIANQELGKSYVQMAVDVLKAPPTSETSELRQWAVATVDKHSPIPLSKELREQLKQGSVEFKVALSSTDAKDDKTTGGIVRYIKCEKAPDADTAQWMIKNIQNTFKKCLNVDEVGIAQYKQRNGPLKEGETQLSLNPIDPTNSVNVSETERSVQCVKTRDKATAEWLLKNYGNTVFRCPKSDEIGVMRQSALSK